MISTLNHQRFGSTDRDSQSLRNDRCQNILYKAVFEHFKNTRNIAALLLASKFFQNSSFGANLVVNFIIDKDSIPLIDSVLSPSSCFSLQFVPSLHIRQSRFEPETVNRRIFNFVGELVNTKYLHLSLRSLTLDFVTNEVLSCFFGSSVSNPWRQLQDLSLTKCVLSDAVLEIISQKGLQLRSMNFSGSLGVTNIGLEHISKLPSITSLDLTHCTEITDSGLEPLAKLCDITSLSLFGCRTINDAGIIEHISKLSGITFLNFSECCRITDAGIHAVSKLCDITFLNLSGCGKITDAGLQVLSGLARITSLHLIGCSKITDAGLQHISKLSMITALSLGWCNLITDAGLGNLFKLSRITSLILAGCDKITVEAKQNFKSALPKCNIE